MDRQIVLPGQIPLDTDLLNTNKNVMLALGEAFQAIFGTNTLAYGMQVTATAPASLSVNIAPGSIYALASVDANAYGSLPADTTDTIVKQGILLSGTTLTLTAPTTAGYSQVVLIEAVFTEVDGQSTLLPFYNAANPAQPLQGPGGNNLPTNTRRQGQVSVVAKYGIAAPTGSQVAPSPDAGYIGLATITLTYAQTQITTASITAVSGNTLNQSLLAAAQANTMSYGVDVGSANACVVNLNPAPSVLIDGMIVDFQVLIANTTGVTLNLNGTGALPIVTAGFTALSSGEFTAGSRVSVQYSKSLNSWVLLAAVGGIQRGVTPPQFDSSTRLATTAFVQASLGNFSGANTVTTSFTLTSAHAGHTVALGGSSNQTATMPPISSVPAGYAVNFVCGTTSTWTIKGSGSDTFAVNTTTIASLTINQGDQVTLVSDGAFWRLASGSVALQYGALFGFSLGGSGYQKLPSGLIIQWGSYSMGTGVSSVSVPWPIAFPNNPLMATTSEGGNTGTSFGIAITSKTAGTAYRSSTSVSVGAYYFAIGY